MRGLILLDVTAVEEDGAAADLACEAHLVRHDDHRHAALGEVLHHVEHLADHLGVERAGRLVEKEDVGPQRQRAGDGDALLQEFYKEQAHAYLPLRAEEWAAHFGIEIRGVKITSARKRWGSCSSRGGLNFSWRLMMAPPEAIDAVIIHELMHRIEFNHSKTFRALEKKNVPNYEACQKQLRETARHFSDI